jgi:hypothetical protein
MRRSLSTITPRDVINLVRPLHVYENVFQFFTNTNRKDINLTIKGGQFLRSLTINSNFWKILLHYIAM